MNWGVCFTPDNGHASNELECPLSANSGHRQPGTSTIVKSDVRFLTGRTISNSKINELSKVSCVYS
jgi:hypothetical protein